MIDYKIEKAKDLIAVLILNHSKIEKVKGLHTIFFEINNNRFFLLQNYIDRLQLKHMLNINQINKTTYTLEPNILTESILKELNIQNNSLNTKTLNMNTFMLMFCLFARKQKNEIIIPSNLNSNLMEFIAIFCKLKTNVYLEPDNEKFFVYNLKDFITQSIQLGRPYYETIQLLLLLNDIDCKNVQKNRGNIMRGRFEYATI